MKRIRKEEKFFRGIKDKEKHLKITSYEEKKERKWDPELNSA